MKAVWSFYATFILALSVAEFAAAGDDNQACVDNDPSEIDVRAGSENYYGGTISYYSRVLDLEAGSKKYIWCIESSINDYLINIEWGDKSNAKKYFDGIVPPGESRARVRTHSSGKEFADRVLKYRVNIDDWREIEIETLYYKKLGEISVKPRVILAQSSDKLSEFRTPDGGLDIDRLKNDPSVLSQYIEAGGEILFGSSGRFDVPVSNKVVSQLKDRTYGKYDKDDFFSFDLFIFSVLKYSGGDNLISTSATVRYPTAIDQKKASVASSENPLLISISPSSEADILQNEYKFELSGYSLNGEAEEYSPFLYEKETKSFLTGNVIVGIENKDGESFGSISATFIIPN